MGASGGGWSRGASRIDWPNGANRSARNTRRAGRARSSGSNWRARSARIDRRNRSARTAGADWADRSAGRLPRNVFDVGHVWRWRRGFLQRLELHFTRRFEHQQYSQLFSNPVGAAGAARVNRRDWLTRRYGRNGRNRPNGSGGFTGCHRPNRCDWFDWTARRARTTRRNGRYGPDWPNRSDGSTRFTGLIQKYLVEFDYIRDRDIVFFNGSSYVLLVSSNLNQQPDTSPSSWALFAQQGSTGTTGAQGATGAPVRRSAHKS